MEVLRRALHSSQPSSNMQSASSDVLETTLDKLTMAGCEEMKILLKSVYYDAYQLKTKDQSREFAKLVGKVTDKEGNGMYYEVRGKDKESCEKQFHTVLCGKPFFVSKLKVAKQNYGQQFYAGLFADFAEKNSRTQFHAMATSHPSSMQTMHIFPTAKSDLGVLKRLGMDRKRVDIIGKVVAMKDVELPNHVKFELWLKDESDGAAVGTDHGGESSQSRLATLCRWAILQRQPQTGTIAATAEAGKDSKHGFCAWLHVRPPGPRAEVLKELTLERGEAIPNAWAGSLSEGSSLRPATEKNKAIITCCSTATACSIVAGESSDVVEIQLHGV
eukprot:symbB.v1.2.040359.t1/scaffold7169.1/size12911/1